LPFAPPFGRREGAAGKRLQALAKGAFRKRKAPLCGAAAPPPPLFVLAFLQYNLIKRVFGSYILA